MGNTLIFIGLLVCIPSFIIGVPIMLAGIIVNAIAKNKTQLAATSTINQNQTKTIQPLPQKYIKESEYKKIVADMITGFTDADIIANMIESSMQNLINQNIKILPDDEFTRITGKS